MDSLYLIFVIKLIDLDQKFNTNLTFGYFERAFIERKYWIRAEQLP